MDERQYVYKITQVVKIVDGDTYWLRCDVGFRQEILINVRLSGYDCPESNRGSDYEKAKALEAHTAAYTFLSMLLPLYIRTEKDPDNFGRWLGDIWAGGVVDSEVVHLGQGLRLKGLASVWPTRWREEFDKAEGVDP